MIGSAARLFRDVGYPRATVRDIAKTVGMQSGSIFYYFKTKEDILVEVMESAIEGRDFILGDDFSMADTIFGGTVRYMLRFNMLDARPSFIAYSERLAARPALQRAEAINDKIRRERVQPS